MEYRIMRDGGAVRWVRARGGAVERDAGGRPVRAAGIVTDVTPYRMLVEEREQALAALGHSERMYRTIAHYFPNGLLALYDRDLRVQVVDGTRSAIGMEPASLVGKTPADVTPPDVLPAIEAAYREALRGGTGTATIRIGARTFELVTHPVRDEKGDVVMGLVMTQEVTERLAMETRLATTARLAALGTLVAGVAHEINNPLASAIADGWLAIRELEAAQASLRATDPPDVKYTGGRIDTALQALRDAQEGEQRIKSIVKDLGLFGRQDTSRERVRLGDVVGEALRWAHATVSAVADVRVEVDEVPPVLGTPGQLGQVVVNLLTNAAQSIPAGRRGTITVRVGRGAGDTVRLEVIDDGQGIDPDEMKRIFDPFFTTREVGKGMGLGLTICHALVTAHGGTISAESEPGRGSTFRVELPVAPERAGEGEDGSRDPGADRPVERPPVEVGSRSWPGAGLDPGPAG
jgi:PAS domain S-box-containing protein